MKIQSAIFVFIVAFLLNNIWENIHSLLYANYQGAAITEYILLRAAIFDAIIILFGIFVAQYFSGFNRMQFLLTFWLFVAIIIEWWALATGRWEYSIAMPLIPFINIGFTPTVQLLITGEITDYIVLRKNT
ncbi:MAG: hypothetical protein AAB795_02060 [Patescibacteria group bacterium]